MNNSFLTTPPYLPAVPMTFGQILDRIFRLLKAGWQPFIAIGIFPFGLFFLLYGAIFAGLYPAGFFSQPPTHPNFNAIILTVAPLYLVMLVVMFLAYGIYYGATTYTALHVDHCHPVTAAESFRHAFGNLGRYCWLYLLRGLIVGAPFLVLMFIFGIVALIFALTSKGNPNPDPGLLFLLIPLGVLLYLGGLVWAVFMALRYSLAFPACLQENLTATQALKRSAQLTEGAKGRIFLVALVIYAISYAGIMVLYIVFAIVAAIVGIAGAGSWDHMSPAAYILLGILGLFVLALLLAYFALLMAAYSISFAVQYRDQCLRIDGTPLAPTETALPS